MKTTEIEPWDRPDIQARIAYFKKTNPLGGTQIRITFTNGYGLSIINFGGLDVEAMVLDLESNGMGRRVPDEALSWVRDGLEADDAIGHLSPDELIELVHNVSVWPTEKRELAE